MYEKPNLNLNYVNMGMDQHNLYIHIQIHIAYLMSIGRKTSDS